MEIEAVFFSLARLLQLLPDVMLLKNFALPCSYVLAIARLIPICLV